MTTIWKKVLLPQTVQKVEVPKGAEILSVMGQHERVVIWFRCNPDNALETRAIAIIGTGHEAPEASESRFIGTVLLENGNLVLHIFERIEK